MIKKLLSTTMLLLVVSPVVAGLASQESRVSADTTTSISREPSRLRDVSGRFAVSFTKPNQYTRVYAGNYDTFVGNGINLILTNGGPENLSWSAMVYNKRTGKQVLKDWVEFKHGSKIMPLYFDKNADIKVGDSFDIEFTNNNYVGPSSVYGDIAPL